MAPEHAGDRDTQLLRAILLTNSGDIAAAEEICQKLLQSDELNANAHYVTALCREYANDVGAAIEHDRTAIYVDPSFSMAHLHLGLLSKRAGDLGSARRELEQAETLLLREDAARILLLGGGFSREALTEFCHAQLRACGGDA
jgi:chemotaxis protein methyltransferase CheR